MTTIDQSPVIYSIKLARGSSRVFEVTIISRADSLPADISADTVELVIELDRTGGTEVETIRNGPGDHMDQVISKGKTRFDLTSLITQEAAATGTTRWRFGVHWQAGSGGGEDLPIAGTIELSAEPWREFP